MQKPEHVTAVIAAEYLGVKIRRFRELVAEGKVHGKDWTDPKTHRTMKVYPSAELAALRGESLKGAAVVPHTGAAVVGGRGAALPHISSAPVGEKQWLTVSEAAAYSGIAEKALLRLIREGKLPALDQHVRGDKWRIRRKTLESFDLNESR
jgi:excisionase family DNA binding protein